MSFVYAEKTTININGEVIPITAIYGDTRITLDDRAANKSNWGENGFKLIQQYGLLKTMIIEPRCCICFAGNEIMYAHKLLEYVFDKKRFTEDDLWDKALEIHQSAPKDAIEFILCTVDDQEESHIVCIKNGEIYRDCKRAWIGSPSVYQTLINLYDPDTPLQGQVLSLSKFQEAIANSGDNSVGGFCSSIRYDRWMKSFVYAYRLELHVERDQTVRPGDAIILYHPAEAGGFAFEIPESNQEFRLNFLQSNCSLIYTNKYRLDESISNEHIKHFMLPVLQHANVDGAPVNNP